MTTPDFKTVLLLDKTQEEVFNAINNVRGWWSGEIEGTAGKQNDEFTYRVGDVHFSKQKVVELAPYQKIEWLVTESNLGFTTNKSEWTNTSICFDISSAAENKTQLIFTHKGLVPAIECFKDCSNAWGQIIQQSLAGLINTGKGVKIF